MLRSSISIISLLLLCVSTFGQLGNEWIDPDKTYYKFKIKDEGYYRITREQLAASGFPVEIGSNRIQLFREGEEVALTVNATNSNFESLEFYGYGKDGTQDAILYESGDQPHTFYSLFTDSASYFITYQLGNESGKRVAFSSDRNTTGLTLESYHLEDTIQLFTNSYAPGIKFGAQAAFSLSKYDDGEGWTGSFLSKNNVQNYTFNLKNYLRGSVGPTIETVLVGGNSLNHNAEIQVGADAASLAFLNNVQFSGWGKQAYSQTFTDGSIGSDGSLSIRLTAVGFPDVAERFAASYMRILFPQSFEMNSESFKVFNLRNDISSKAWLKIPTTSPNELKVFDITDPINAIRIAVSVGDGEVDVVLPDAGGGSRVLAVSGFSSVGEIEEVSLQTYDFTNTNFLIITHEDLRLAEEDPVLAYANYRESAAGGSYSVRVANISDLYNTYSFGDPSTTAIRNFITDASRFNEVESVFIIGKGFTPDFNYYRSNISTLNVPTYGFPGSDLMFGVGVGTDPDIPGVAIGRLNAKSPADVSNYLSKVVEMEALPFDDLWRKDFLQLSGGKTDREIEEFISIIQGFASDVADDFIGGKAYNSSRRTSQAVEFIDVTDRINQGVGYVTFFGHSSGSTTDIEIGLVSDARLGFSNRAKYPVFLVNGCQAGEIYGGSTTFGEDWMTTPNLGAIAFLAHSNVALSSTLKKWSDLFYEVGFGEEEFIGRTIGDVVLEVSQRYFSQNGSGSTNLTQLQQMTLQGDPAIKLFGGDKPDFAITANEVSALSIDNQEVLASQDSFKIEFVVRNFGRTVEDSLEVEILRTLPNGQQEVYSEMFERTLRQDTLIVYIQNDPTAKNDGVNLFNLSLDPNNEVEELNETNNGISFDVSIFKGNTLNLFPIDNAIVSDFNVNLQWQSSNLLEDSRGYEMEFDTQADFAGPNNRKFSVSGETLLSQNFDFSTLSLADSTTIYWRTRFSEVADEETNEWVTSSFTIVNGASDGWGQFEVDQINQETISGINYDELANRWAFLENTTPIDIFTFGEDNVTFSYEDLSAIIGGVDFFITTNPRDTICKSNTLNAIAFDKETGDPYQAIPNNGGDVFNEEICGRIPQRIYQFDEDDLLSDRRRLQVLADNMRDGDMIVFFNIGRVNYSNFDSDVLSTMESFGVSSSTIGSLEDGQPIIFLGRKGDSPGSALIVIDNGSPIPRTEQSLSLQEEVIGRFVNGEIRSRRIGPATDWNALSYNISEEVNDQVTVDLFGVDPNGNMTELQSRARIETIDISQVDPVLYPQVELSFSFSDEVDQTPPQLNNWGVTYQQPAEGLLFVSDKEPSKIQEGQEISRTMHFYNLASEDFTDSLSVMSRLINQDGSVVESSFMIAPPMAGDTSSFDVSFSSFNKGGNNSLLVEVSANENEIYTTNNRIVLTNIIEVTEDETNPILDVTFDGYHIIDGDVVSPNPSIVVRLRDDNPFIPKSDTVGINISLRLPGEDSQFQRINFSDPRVTYSPASENQDFQITFEPGPLSDGLYSIQIQGEDEAGNQAGVEPFEVSFEVINESTITHFYPYPNPFSTSCRFVFTLTGTEIPDELKIQILTVSGRVIREITQDEIGPIRVGNNITSYAWDGRDENGDQLANGVYFYKVFVNSSGNEVTKRSTSADKAFKNGFGKLYILR